MAKTHWPLHSSIHALATPTVIYGSTNVKRLQSVENSCSCQPARVVPRDYSRRPAGDLLSELHYSWLSVQFGAHSEASWYWIDFGSKGSKVKVSWLKTVFDCLSNASRHFVNIQQMVRLHAAVFAPRFILDFGIWFLLTLMDVHSDSLIVCVRV